MAQEQRFDASKKVKNLGPKDGRATAKGSGPTGSGAGTLTGQIKLGSQYSRPGAEQSLSWGKTSGAARRAGNPSENRPGKKLSQGGASSIRHIGLDGEL